MQTLTINEETRNKAKEIYGMYKEVIDSDAVNGTGWQKAVALTFIQLAGSNVEKKSTDSGEAQEW